MPWVRALRADALAAGSVRPLDLAGHPLAAWRTVDGRVVVCDARCPHQWSHLGVEGVVDGDELVCLAHGWRFGPDGAGTKRAMSGRVDPKAPVEVHPVREHEGWIEVELDHP